MSSGSHARASRPLNPVLIELTRGPRIESIHRGAAAVMTAAGDVVASWGDIDSPVFVRSAAKPLQAMVLVESGAADAFVVTSAELALACGSHGGEAQHVACVAGWLSRLGLDQGALVCGAHPPLNAEAAAGLIRDGTPVSPIHNNCSGKHAGFLTAARHLGLPLASYGEARHPLQQQVRQTIAEIAETALPDDMVGIDGCGVSAFALPLRGLASAFARMAQPAALSPRRGEAVKRILAAMAAHPRMVAGSGRFDTAVIIASNGRIISKGGAEGVHAAAVPSIGLGIALKIDDGGKRAAEAAMAALLGAYARPETAARHCLAGYSHQPLRNTRGVYIGEVRTAAGWPSA